ncbi:MFS transporter [Rhodoferax sp.]|uniref:MFS transporter n=1 Tax=Rhodoferax sp. TaxID=50421 RepID=UPI00374D638A
MTSNAEAAPWSVGDGLRYGLLGLPLAFCALPLYVLMPNLYARQWGVPLAALGAVLLGARLLDAVIDPLLGRLCDRLFAQSLRAVLSMGALAAAVLAVGFAFIFVPLLHQPTALLWWAGAWLVVTYGAYSALSVAHQSWGAMLGGDALYRSRVVAWREGLGLVGVLLAVLTPALLGLPAMLALLLLGLVAGWWAWSRAPQPVVPSASARDSTPRDAGALWHPWRNADFRRLLGVYLLNGIASAIPATLVLFFMQDRLQASAALQSVALGVYFLFGALSMPLWLRLVRRLGLARSWQAGMILSIAVFLGASQLGAGDALWFLLVCALSGAALGSDLALPGALLAGLIAKAGDRGRAEGAYFGWWNFATKLNLALAAGLALPLLGWLGYAPGARDAHAAALLTAAYCLLPCVLKALAAGALHFFIIQPTAQPHTP